MIYVQLRGFPGLAAREVNKMSNFNSKDNQKIIKRNQKHFKSIRRGGILFYAQLRGFYGAKGLSGIKKAEKGARGGMGS